MQYVLLTTMIVGMVEAVQAGFERDWRTVVTIIFAGAIGALCGWLAVEGLDVPTGIAVGLSASGLVTVAKKI